jgi:hypothetical protein
MMDIFNALVALPNFVVVYGVAHSMQCTVITSHIHSSFPAGVT